MAWLVVIADLYRGRQTMKQVEAAIKAARSDPLQTRNWPCQSSYYLGEYKLEHGDIAGAKADLGKYSVTGCPNGLIGAGLADIKRLPAN
jgi:lipoprotein NlpI